METLNSLKDVNTLLSGVKPQDDDNLDGVISDALKELSVQDREQVYHDIHGICEAAEETPAFIDAKLEEFQQALDNILTGSTTTTTTSTTFWGRSLPTAALELAIELDSAYVRDRSFQLQFLRTDNFDPTLAAERMVRFFDFKFSIFGGEKLCKDITWDDLDQDDINALKRGFMQWLPERDRAGRPVGIMFPCQQYYDEGSDIGKTYGRLLYYCLFILNDEVTQKKGYVSIIYNVGKFDPSRLYNEVPPVFYKAYRSIPRKIGSLHLCFSNPLFRFLLQHIVHLFGPKRSAVKVHQGSQQEVHFQLMTYGIPTASLPVKLDGNLTKNNHTEMMRLVRTKEEYSKNQNGLDYCVIPYLNDVLFGRGEPCQCRAGNVRLKNLVDELLPQYDKVERDEKMEMQMQVVKTVHLAGGRFLSQESGVWMEVPIDAAKRKVATLFRNRRKAYVKNQKAAVSSASKTFRCEEIQSPSALSAAGGNSKRVRV